MARHACPANHTMLVHITPNTENLGTPLEPPGCIEPLCQPVGKPSDILEVTPIELTLVRESESHEWPQRELAALLMGWIIEERRLYGPPNREDIIVLNSFGVWFPMH